MARTQQQFSPPTPPAPPPPHVLMFPLSVQSHINSMLKLAELLSLAGLHVTFVVSHYAYARLHFYANADYLSRLNSYAGFCFHATTDGLPEDHPRTGERVVEISAAVKSLGRTFFMEMVAAVSGAGEGWRPVKCVVGDKLLNFAAEFAAEIGISFFSYRAISACCYLANYCTSEIAAAGQLPLIGTSDKELDQLVTSVPGMETFLRRRDIPRYCRVDSVDDPVLKIFMSDSKKVGHMKGLIMNTFEDLEGPVISHLRTQMPLNLFTIGPVHHHVESKLQSSVKASSSSSFWKEDYNCLTWLDSQPSRSVLYVSFGSIMTVTKAQLTELWYGLVNSETRFLLVLRPELITDDKRGIPVELSEATKERGYIVEWAPQEEVLNHPAVSGFFTHSGWNSTMESIVAGVPMICWPHSFDQLINSRFVSEVWKIGLDMKDNCDRTVMESMVRDLMDVRKYDFRLAAERMANMARESVGNNGSSYSNLDRLIEGIRST